jgi:hypothetical protein
MNEGSSTLRYTCACCGKTFNGLPALAFSTPSNFPQMPLWRRLTLGSKMEDLYISSEQDARFVRCVLQIPILGTSETLDWGVWCSLSRDSFKRYRRTFRGRAQSKLGSMSSWFSSHCPGYPETFGLTCKIIPQDERMRPLVELEACDHPLSVDQREGVTMERAVELAGPWLRQYAH